MSYYEKEIITKLEKGGAKYLANNIFEEATKTIANKGYDVVFDYLVVLSFRDIINSWQTTKTEEASEEINGKIITWTKHYLKNVLDLKVGLEVLKLTQSNFEQFLAIEKKSITKQKIQDCLEYLTKINWLVWEEDKFCMHESILKIAGGRKISRDFKPDYKGSDLNDNKDKFYKLGEYQLAELFGRILVNYGSLDNSVVEASYATSLGNLANVYLFQGKFPEAEALLLQAIEIAKKTVGENHPKYATYLNNLATVYDSQGKFPEAEALLLQAIEIAKKTVGENHPKYATHLNNLGVLYYNWYQKEKDTPTKDRKYQGEIIDLLHLAEPNLEIALKIRIKKLGKDHPNTKTIQSWLDKVKKALEQELEQVFNFLKTTQKTDNRLKI